MSDPELPWTNIERLLPDDRRLMIEAAFQKIKVGRFGNRPEIAGILSDPESAWIFGNAICEIKELEAGKAIVRRKVGTGPHGKDVHQTPGKELSDLCRRLDARQAGLVEDIARARRLRMASAGLNARVAVSIESPGRHVADAVEHLVTALEALDDAISSLARSGPADDSLSNPPEVRFAETFGLLVSSSGGELSGDKSGGRFRDLLRAVLEACDIIVPEHRLKAAASSAIAYVESFEQDDI